MSKAVMKRSELPGHGRDLVLATRAAFLSSARSGCLGEIDGQMYLRALDEYERHVRNAAAGPEGASATGPAGIAPATRDGAQTELDWVESERSWVLDCYGGNLPIS
jgi:hypothetical protein